MVSKMKNTDSKTAQTATSPHTTARNPRLDDAGFFNTKTRSATC